MEMNLSDPNLTHSDSFHQIYIVFASTAMSFSLSFMFTNTWHKLNTPQIIINCRIGLMLVKTYSTFRIKHYEDIHLQGLEIDCQERLTH